MKKSKTGSAFMAFDAGGRFLGYGTTLPAAKLRFPEWLSIEEWAAAKLQNRWTNDGEQLAAWYINDEIARIEATK